MEIIPKGYLYLCQNVKLDPQYDNTVYFPPTQAGDLQRLLYFESKSIDSEYTRFNDMNYQRVSSNKIKVQAPYEVVSLHNYMFFTNRTRLQESDGTYRDITDYPVFCFIINCTYITPVVTEIEYKVDVLQTFHSRYSLETCFVEREHTESDVIGEHILKEPVDAGEFLRTELTEEVEQGASIPAFGQYASTSIVVAATFDANYNDVIGTYYNGVFSGLFFHTFDNTYQGATNLANFIANAGGKQDGVIAVFLIPKRFVGVFTSQTPLPFYHNINVYQMSPTNGFAGYVPNNNKLYTSQYNYLEIYDNADNTVDLKPEKFTLANNTMQFKVYLDMSTEPTLVCIPLNYMGMAEAMPYKITLGPFPQLAYNTDTFKQWYGLSQMGWKTAQAILSPLAQSGAGFLNGYVSMGMNPLGGAGAIISGIANVGNNLINLGLEENYMSKLPNVAHGNNKTNALMATIGKLRWHAYRVFADYKHAKAIDDFFTMFGYRVSSLKTVNRKARPHFTYVKLGECNMSSDKVPYLYSEEIRKAYLNGIRWWVNGDEIGDYSLAPNNRPLVS